MELEDSRNALYCDPNAFIQRIEKKEDCKRKKIVFQEPYESLPAFYINNNFQKHDCACVPKFNHDCKNSSFINPRCNEHNNDCKCNDNNCKNSTGCNGKCHQEISSKPSPFGFDLKSLLPLLSLFNKGGGADFSQLVGLFNNANNSQNGNNSNPMSFISSILSNTDSMNGIMRLFSGGGLTKTQPKKNNLKTTDFEIKNYTRVE